MEIFKNNQQTNFLTTIQGEANVTVISFKIPFDDLNLESDNVNINDYLGIIQFKDDFLTTIPNANVVLSKEDNFFKLEWTVGKAIPLHVQTKEFQVIIKNKIQNITYRSQKLIFKVLKSLTDNLDEPNDCQCETTCIAGYLEQFAYKIDNIINEGVGDFVAIVEFNKLKEKVSNNETEISNIKQEVQKNTQNLTEISAKVDNSVSLEKYNNDISKLATKDELSNKADKENTYTKTEVDNLIPNTSNFATKNELAEKLDINTFNSQKDNFQLKQDNSLITNDKTIVGAINEVANKSNSGDNSNNNVDLTNYYNKTETDALLNNKADISQLDNFYNKSETDNLLSQKADNTTVENLQNSLNSKQNITDTSLTTTDKTITGAINEIHQLANNGGGGNNDIDSSKFVTTDEFSINGNTLKIPLGKDGNLNAYSSAIAIANPQYDITVNQNTVYLNPYYIPSDVTNRTIPSYSAFINCGINSYNTSTGYNVGIGYGAIAGKQYSVSIGASATSTQEGVSVGYNAFSDDKSVAIGHYAYANGYNDYYSKDNICIGNNAGRFMYKTTPSGSYYGGHGKQQCIYIGSEVKTNYKSSAMAINEIAIGYNAYGNGDNTITLGNSYIQQLFCQVGAITQSCDIRLKDNIKNVDVNEIINALMKIDIIYASYKNIEEFKGANSVNKHKLMWNADNLSEIPLFAKDVTISDKVITPLNEKGEYANTKTVTVTEQRVINTFDEDNNEITKTIDVEVKKEIPITEIVENCKEFTPTQIPQALVVAFQEQQKIIKALEKRIEALENKSKGVF